MAVYVASDTVFDGFSGHNVQLLAKDLSTTLFERDSPEASRFKIEIVRSKNLILSGGHWKNDVIEWLKKKGF